MFLSELYLSRGTTIIIINSIKSAKKEAKSNFGRSGSPWQTFGVEISPAAAAAVVNISHSFCWRHRNYLAISLAHCR